MSGEMKFETWPSLAVMFFERAAELGDRPFLWAKHDGRYQPLTWREVRDRVSLVARGLHAIGIAPGDKVMLVAENRPEWMIAELAILACRAVAVPAYTTNTDDDHIHILDNSDAVAAIVSTRKLAAQLLPAAHRAIRCKHVIAMEDPELHQDLGSIAVHRWDDIVTRGAELPDEVEGWAAKANRSDTAVIIHTSGTGGTPKGVMLHHGAILSNCLGGWDLFKDDITFGEEIFLSFLPLSHAYEHMAGHFLPVGIGAQIYYAESVETLVTNMAEVRPTIMTAVPRLYEAMHGRIRRAMDKETGLKKTMFTKAVALGRKRYEDAGNLGLGERVVDALLDRLVRRKVAGRFGGRLKFFVSGGAPLNYDIGMFFTALGVKLLQGYGMTESAPLISCNPVHGHKIHTVGPPVRGVELRIAEDGEICVRGELVMQGYYKDDAATRQVIRDGWLHTGDIGHLDHDGHIIITDRKKDIIVNSGGDNVSPQRVEGFLTLQPEIGQAMVIGDKRPHLVALLVPEEEFLRDWTKANGKPNDLDALAGDAELHDTLTQAVERVNKELGVVERVRRFVVAPEFFSIENGMMTPSMKIRRHIIKEKYGSQLEALYGR